MASTLKAGCELFNGGDVDGMLALLDPEFELHTDPTGPDPGVFRGREGFLRNLARMRESFEPLTWEVEELIGLDDDRVLVNVRFVGHGKESGLRMEEQGAHVWTLNEGRAVRLDSYVHREQALAAVGRTEQPPSR